MDKTIKYAGAECYYRIEGKGKTIMLVHGFVEEGSMWNNVVNELKKNYKLIVPDLPGFGKSPLSVNDISMEWYAGFLHEIIKAEKTERLILLGHSMGGYITLSFAETYGDLLSGFGLINSHCFEDSAVKRENRLKGIDFIRKHGTQLFVREMYYSIFNESYKSKNIKFIDSLIQKAQRYTAEAVISANRAMMNRKDNSEVLKTAQVPVLFINGEDDESAPLAFTLKQASYPAVGDFNLYAKCKHMSVFERKSETLKIVNAFCSRAFN